MTVTTIIVNGFARAGKDSFVDACIDHLETNQIRCEAFSSIDPVRWLLQNDAGLDLSAKTPADRKLLADVGAALEQHSNWRTNRCLDFIKDFDLGGDDVVFLHIREPENIAKVIGGIIDGGLGNNHTLLLRSPREIMPDNVADNAVLGMIYDDTLHNDGDLDALSILAGHYLARKGLIK